MKKSRMIRSFLARAAFFAVLWALLSKNSWSDWPLIVVCIAAAVAVSAALWPVGAWQWRLVPLLRFVPYFIKESVTGGVDVARRVFTRKIPLDPGFVDFRLRLETEEARVFFVWMVSLLPGTASVRMEGGNLLVHVLDQGQPVEMKLRQLEAHVAGMFGDVGGA
jgi:multicomponent Na+:H+ antiporter subunit E